MINNDDYKWHCFYCGAPLSWHNSVMGEDVSNVYSGDNEAVIDIYVCSECGRTYEMYMPSKEERDGEYRKFWHKINKDTKGANE